MALNLIMKNSFFRKIAFGLNLDDDIPDDPLGWAIKQISNIICFILCFFRLQLCFLGCNYVF
jgi:hypothetical protein